ncbi:MAG: NADP-dependent malic enzyme [Nitrospinae bacterium]|nr:NADP-dependent malic enzyme [Nitrospinota bacterium]
MSINDSLEYRRRHRGVIGIDCKIPIKDESVLSLIYTPGVAEPSLKIAENPVNAFEYTCRGNTIAIVTDGSRVLGLGNLGARAAMPVIEGKSVIFKTFGGVDAIPICLETQDTEEIIRVVTAISPTFGAICLEDIAAPKCFTIQHHLREALRICVFHNDQHAAAIEIYAGLINASKLVEKDIKKLKIVICGAGAAGIATANILLRAGMRDITLCDTNGIIHKRRLIGMNWAKLAIARKTNLSDKKGDLTDAIKNADVFIGLSRGDIFTAEMVSAMAKDPIVFALSVPEPEILPSEAIKGGAKIVATGRSDFHNGINIALVYPGFFRGILDSAARNVNFPMIESAAKRLASLVPPSDLNPKFIMPKVFDFQVAPAIAEAVAEAAVKTGEAAINVDPKKVRERLESFIYEGHFPLPPENNHEQSLTLEERSLRIHERHKGVIEVRSKIPIRDKNILSSLYLPPAAAIPPKEIASDPAKIYEYTCKGNLVAVVSDGSAVLGLGNIGPWAALPVMEGKCALFHTLAGVEAFPLCISTQTTDEIVEVVKNISPAIGGVNLEDISAPRCFIIEERLKKEIDIPVFHDDQHGTAVVVLAGLINALKLTGREINNIKMVVNGAGAAATAVTKLLISCGVNDIVMLDTHGIIYKGRGIGMNWKKEEMAGITNPENIKGGLSDAIKGRDVFIGVSVGGVLKKEMIKEMAGEPIVFALANPIPEIMPTEAIEAGARIVATGRSDFPNQVNNSLAFPGIFRGALDVRAREINEAMKLAAAHALSDAVLEDRLKTDYIIPKGLDYRVPPLVASAVAKAAIKSGVARVNIDPQKIAEVTKNFIYEGELGII